MKAPCVILSCFYQVNKQYFVWKLSYRLSVEVNCSHIYTSPFANQLWTLEQFIDVRKYPFWVFLRKYKGGNCRPLAQILWSLNTGRVPWDWRRADVTPILRVDSKSDPGIYRPKVWCWLWIKLWKLYLSGKAMGRINLLGARLYWLK